MPRGLRFGICTDQHMSWDLAVERWRLFDDLGFDSPDCDHYVQPSRPTGPYFEGWTLLAALADMVGQYREAGVNGSIVDQPAPGQLPMAERIAAERLPRLKFEA
jgi:hypothetical protein